LFLVTLKLKQEDQIYNQNGDPETLELLLKNKFIAVALPAHTSFNL